MHPIKNFILKISVELRRILPIIFIDRFDARYANVMLLKNGADTMPWQRRSALDTEITQPRRSVMSLIKSLTGSLVFAVAVSLSLFTLFSPTANAAEPSVAGTVIHVKGSANVVRGSSTTPLTVGKQVSTGDGIVTGKDARVGLKMIDGGVLRLGADTVFIIEDYAYSEQASEGRARMFMLKGAMRVITGAIGKLKERDLKLDTVVATMGVRGTDFWIGYYFSDALDVALISGAGVYADNAAGRMEITRAGDGIAVKAVDQLPAPPIHWGQKKYDAALKSVAWEGEAEYGK